MRLEFVLLMLSVIAPSSPPTPSTARLFQSMFASPGVDQPATLDVIRKTRQGERFRVVCGMTLVAPDPGLQFRMPTLPPRQDLDHTLRVEEPPVCSGREERSR
jgi:hypothetical protein